MSEPVTTLPAAVSTAVGPLFRGPDHPVTVVAVFPRAAYVTTVDDGLLAIVTSDGVHHPNAAVVSRASSQRPFRGLRAGQRGHLGDQRLLVGDLRVRLSRWWDPRPRLGSIDADTLGLHAAAAATRVRAVAGETTPTLRDPLADVVAGLITRDADACLAGARRLIGAGPGLTPAGDDVLAGLVSGLLLLAPVTRAPGAAGGQAAADLVAVTSDVGARIAAAARDRTTAVSAALLRHAARGEVAVPAAAFLHAVTGRGSVAAATDGLLAVGATSGHDLIVGLLAAADLVRAGYEHPTTALLERTR